MQEIFPGFAVNITKPTEINIEIDTDFTIFTSIVMVVIAHFVCSCCDTNGKFRLFGFFGDDIDNTGHSTGTINSTGRTTQDLNVIDVTEVQPV